MKRFISLSSALALGTATATKSSLAEGNYIGGGNHDYRRSSAIMGGGDHDLRPRRTHDQMIDMEDYSYDNDNLWGDDQSYGDADSYGW
jgi:hypothetical protein